SGETAMFRSCLFLTAVVLVNATAHADQARDQLARAAEGVLQRNCARCHANGQAEGGFNFILDARQLVEKKKVVAGKSAESRLYKKVKAGEMPPEDEKPRPTPVDIAAIKAWIDAGAPEFPVASKGRTFLSEEWALTVVRDHLRNLPAPSGQPFQRYFSLIHLHNNPAISDEDLRWHRAALSKAINS